METISKLNQLLDDSSEATEKMLITNNPDDIEVCIAKTKLAIDEIKRMRNLTPPGGDK